MRYEGDEGFLHMPFFAWSLRLYNHTSLDSMSISFGNTEAKMSWDFEISCSFSPSLKLTVAKEEAGPGHWCDASLSITKPP